jgi:hypothetical protein
MQVPEARSLLRGGQEEEAFRYVLTLSVAVAVVVEKAIVLVEDGLSDPVPPSGPAISRNATSSIRDQTSESATVETTNRANFWKNVIVARDSVAAAIIADSPPASTEIPRSLSASRVRSNLFCAVDSV